MLPTDTVQAAYHGDGPILPGESVHQAMGANTVASLAGHLIPSPAPGHGFEDEPLNNAEKASQDTAQAAAQALPNYSLADTSNTIRGALRPGE